MSKILKQCLAILVIIAASSTVFAQNKKGNNNNIPTQNELQQMIQEMQKEMENMDPDAKEMMKKMGSDMPDMDKLGFAVSGDYEEIGPIPKRDAERIEMAGRYKLNSSNLTAYVGKVHNAVCAKVGAGAAKTGQEIYQMSKSNGGGAQAANGLWAFGANLPAVVVLGNALISDPNNADNLNNYAAFLVMTGAEEGALPILEYLNKIYPKNSTILNNIGQAWFGLGDLDKAENYLDSVIALYAGHSQANYTKSLIRENKGDKVGAVSAAKRSLKTAYSPSKERRLNELGYELKGSDVSWQTSLPKDPLGFGQMNWPRYPKSVSESEALGPEWESFRESTGEKSAVVDQKFQKAQAITQENLTDDPMKMFKQAMNTNLKLPQFIMPFSEKARAKMDYYRDDDELELSKYERLLTSNDSVQAEMYRIEQKYEKEFEALEKSQGHKIGEGSSSADMEAYCAERDKINDKYLAEVNTILEKENQKWLTYWQKTMSRRLNYYQYSMPEDAFEMEKLRAQLMWLGMIGGQEVIFANKCTILGKEPVKKPVQKTLADFYDMTCKQKSVMNLGIGSVTIECNKMTTEVEAWFVKYSSKENMDNGKIIKGTLEVSFGLGDKGIGYGPVKAEIGAGGSAFVEFDNEGVTDIGLKLGVSAEVGTDVLPDGMPKEAGIHEQKVTVLGAEARWGWNSGCSVENKGLLSGLKLN